MSRTARIERATSESKVVVEVDLDGSGRHDISTGVGFYDHMLNALAKHALLDRGVLVREVGPDGWLRVSIGTPNEMKSFRLGLTEVMEERS